jgi:formylglycine-generating enzyme required for sulfatase activity
MNKQSPQLLKQIICQHGIGIIRDIKLLESLFNCYALGQFREDISLYIQTIKEGVVDALQHKREQHLQALCLRLVMQLVENCHMRYALASTLVEDWVVILDLPGSTNHIPDFTKPEWSKTLNKDSFGFYVDIDFSGINQRFRWISPGRFLMGSPELEINHYEDETLHEVILTQGFWLGDTACTQALWKVISNTNPSDFRAHVTNPVEQVSWNDVQDFLSHLNILIPGLNARLPTAAQWEYACRAGTLTPFSFGDNITTDMVNYDGTKPYGNGKKGIFRKATVPVKSFPANAFGLYEMHGNVWEWCNDWYGVYPSHRVIDPAGSDTGVTKILRGGSWFRGARGVRSANRSGDLPNAHNFQIGFRFVVG